MTVGPGRLSADCWGDVGVKWNLLLNLRLKISLLYLKLRAENWFTDTCRMWDSDFCVGIMSMKNNIDLSFCGIDMNHAWYDMMSDALLFRSPSREQGGCWGCSRTRCRDIDVTVFGVSTWNNGDVSGECSYLVSSGGAHCFTVVLLHLSFSTSSGRLNIHVPFLCSTSRVPPLNLSRHSPRPGV